MHATPPTHAGMLQLMSAFLQHYEGADMTEGHWLSSQGVSKALTKAVKRQVKQLKSIQEQADEKGRWIVRWI